MAFPQVVAVAPGSPAAQADVAVGDEIVSMNGVVPRDVIEFAVLADQAELVLEVGRGGLVTEVTVEKHAGEQLGIEVSSALFDRVRTCDNHCEFCFIYQLPKGLRKSLYLKDDDYRLSFLYGNFTTLTRFTELDLARVIDEALSPLYVSIHATDPDVRARMQRTRRGASSLRWLAALLEAGITVHGQVVVCPDVNDGDVLEDTLAGVLERFPALASVALVPLGVSRFSGEAAMRAHTSDEAEAVLDTVDRWQAVFRATLGRPMVFAADEYYLLANRPFPSAEDYGDFAQHENGIGMAARFADDFSNGAQASDRRGGFFQSVDAAPAEGYRAPRLTGDQLLGAHIRIGRGEARTLPLAILTGSYGARVLSPLLVDAGRSDVDIVAVDNDYFGGNIGVAGLLTGQDLSAAIAEHGEAHYLLPDVCLNEGRFLDGMTIDDLPGYVEVIGSDGAALRQALDEHALVATP